MNDDLGRASVLVALIATTGPTLAAGEAGLLATATFYPDALVLQPLAADNPHVLRVSCDNGGYFSQTFAAGEAPVYSIEFADSVADDGEQCDFELRVIPEFETDNEFGEVPLAQFGSFTHSNGVISLQGGKE